MQRPDMRIAIPARPSPLTHDAPPSLSSSCNSTSSSSTMLMTPASHSSDSGCLHRSDDRPGTPYPGDCQLCFTGHQVEQRKAPAADLGALTEEEEPVPEMGEATAVTMTAIQPEEVTPCLVSSSTSLSSSRASSDSTSAGDDRNAGVTSGSETAHSKSSTKPRKSRRSWIKRVLVFEHIDAPIGKKVISTTSTPSTSVSASTPTTPATAARPPASTSTPTTVPPTAAPSAYRPRCFAPITLVPTIDYAYTAENSCWKAPPVISQMAERNKQVKSYLPLQRRLSEDRENLV